MISRIKEFIIFHKVAFLIAILTGIICVLPYLLAPISLGGDYKGIPFLYQDNEEVYLSRINEVKEKHFNISSPIFFEYKENDTAQQPMGEWIYALFGTILPFDFFIIFSKFLFPALLFFLIYIFVFRVNDGRNKSLAIFVSICCLLGYEMTRLSFIKEIFFNPNLFHLSIWTRLVNPITGGIFLFTFLNLLLSLYEKRINFGKKYSYSLIILLGIVLGFMTGYYFSFILTCSILGFFAIFCLYKRDFRIFWPIVFIFFIGFLININYALNIITLPSSQALKSGMILTHMPVFNKIQFVVFLILLFRIKSYKDKKWIVSAIFFLSSIFSINIHLITGQAIWPAHFVQYTNLLAFISVGLLLSNFNKRIYIFGSSIILILSILTIPSFAYKIDDYEDIQRRAGVFEWLNNNSYENNKNDCVVLSFEPKAKLTWAIPAYTKCDSYISPYVFSNVPNERIMHNFLTMLYIRDGEFNTDDMREYFFRDWRDIFNHQPDRWLRSISDQKNIDDYYINLEKEIKDNFKNYNFDSDINKYKIDYIVWDSVNASTTNPIEKMKNLKQVYEKDGILVFEINN